MSNTSSGTYPSLGVILFLIFMVLKLTGHITWSWLWVTAPLWIHFVLIIVVASFVIYRR